MGVRRTYFGNRRGGSLTLYQDAHVKDGRFRRLNWTAGRSLSMRVVGWISVTRYWGRTTWSTSLGGPCLIREPTRPLPPGGDLTLGELLKYKSQDGVRVVGTLFTHHQKCVLVDAQASGNNRKITAFIGGLDLCDGRYERQTPDHRLFRDLDTVYSNDFHNPTFAADGKGPRQPWHDLHCKIEGPAAYDVLTNFEQRWKKAIKWSEFGQRFIKVRHWNDDALIKLERISWILSPSPAVPIDDPRLWVSNEDDRENWHIQVFRSIDSGSVKGFPKLIKNAQAKAQTMRMMYEIVGRELKFALIENSHPQDYLNFYCLGNREELPRDILKSTNQQPDSTPLGMIVDDEYVILGSANINQRSLDGSRDTEIAMGAYQHHHTWAEKKRHPHGQVYGYRMSLWAEHLGKVDEIFKEPESLECVRLVNEMAEENWRKFAAEEVMPLPGHLLKYPIKVDVDGTVGPLPDYENFPDVGGKILGECKTLPDALTT
ncbi:Phospholipase D delta [Acorus calamus]|uniref:phospholipase D n=1 Tax=Acorus calamus TaxID=4465 RepID=A0AAV9F847_ACOCL|nr:Phospholipase D delta [Acorus calamus]